MILLWFEYILMMLIAVSVGLLVVDHLKVAGFGDRICALGGFTAAVIPLVLFLVL